MNIRTVVALCSLGLAGSVFGEEGKITILEPTPPPAPPKEPVKKPEPKKKEEPPAKIEGITIPRGKNFLGIAIVGGNFKLSFYDAKKKPVAPDVTRAALHWPVHYKVGEERVVLNPAGDGKSLTAGKAIRPPYAFKLFITLLTEGAAEGAGETYVVDFHQ